MGGSFALFFSKNIQENKHLNFFNFLTSYIYFERCSAVVLSMYLPSVSNIPVFRQVVSHIASQPGGSEMMRGYVGSQRT